MLAKVQSALAKLLEPGQPLLVGVSGGPDSVALLDVLVKLGYRPHIAHLNHQLRGAESDADAEFVRQLAGKYGLPVTIGSQSVAADEDSCRQARLAFFERVAAQTGIHILALAHNADDQVETFLMRLLRGAGPTGLSGMRADRLIGTLRVVRPLLEVSRVEILAFLKALGLSYREDSSNANRRFLRNRIRHELLPLLERDYNPGIRDVLRRTAEILRAEAESDSVAAERRAIRAWLGESPACSLSVATNAAKASIWIQEIAQNGTCQQMLRLTTSSLCIVQERIPMGALRLKSGTSGKLLVLLHDSASATRKVAGPVFKLA